MHKDPPAACVWIPYVIAAVHTYINALQLTAGCGLATGRVEGW